MKQLLTRVLAALLVLGCVFSLPAQQPATDKKHFEEVKAKADKGDAQAQLDVGNLYFAGIGVKRDPRKGVKYHKKAAEQGLAAAQMELAGDYSRGDGVEPDAFEAFRWYALAADQGVVEAQLRCGVCFAKGDGVPRNPVEAFNYFRRAADQGYPPAQYEVAKCLFEGEGISKDTEEAVKWVRKSAAQGFSTGQYRLGVCYMKGEGMAKDNLQAYKWLSLAAGQGGPDLYEAKIALSKVETLLSPEEISVAQRLSREFRPGVSEPGTSDAAPPVSEVAPVVGTGQPVALGKFGWVMVTAPDDGSEVFVDRDFVGNTPAKLKLSEGTHLIEVKRAGFKGFNRQIKVSDGAELTLRATLEKE